MRWTHPRRVQPRPRRPYPSDRHISAFCTRCPCRPVLAAFSPKGQNMVVGALADIEDYYEDLVRADFTGIREVLARSGAGPWHEPELDERDALSFDMWGYSGLHTVRRLAVHLAENAPLPEPLKGRAATDDPLLKKAYVDLPTGRFAHLIHHSDCEGYYVPVAFALVLTDARLPGGYLGSSMRLLTETRTNAAPNGMPEANAPATAEDYEAAEAPP